MQTLDSTIVNTALPSMARSLGESPLRMESVVVAYTLTMAMVIPASGWIADRFGMRTTFLAAIVLFVGLDRLRLIAHARRAGRLACAAGNRRRDAAAGRAALAAAHVPRASACSRR